MTEPTSPLQIPDYRRYWVARFLAVFATISMVVLLGYQTYDMARADYGMTRPQAAFQLGLLGLVQFVPLMLLTPLAGLAADRFDRRRVVLAANLVDCFIAAALAWMTWQDALTLPIIFSLAALHGGARVFNGPALSAIAPNIVPARLLPRAIAFGSIAWQAGSVIGPFAGGLMFEYERALPYGVSVVLLLLSGGLISTIRPVRAKHEGPPIHPLRQMADGFRFVTKERFLLGCITLDLFAVILAGATALLPVYARDILYVGADGLGLMRGAIALGAALVALGLSFRPLENNVGVKMLWAVVVFGGATIAFAVSENFYLSLALLVVLGATDMISVFIRTSLVQLYTPDHMRGRVSSISGLAISASNELGELQSGVAAAMLGTVGAVIFGGVGAIVVTALWAVIFPELRRARTFAVKYDEAPTRRTAEAIEESEPAP
ncbi:MFS transporter [Erythrobacter arachoides]|uniref:MFS transporter n=1 Tax=Aurantiacibacter arachoides TaxID=1850444 RepID=A0A845A0T5_9SPHN|nr:MFS transporter [Aurantiacibacter arachoides]MXO93160.1 MFS transporter [Aurantiacibacter arachoides]GGD51567.1 MFS transporter [Aurantiacibacter arachoides]